LIRSQLTQENVPIDSQEIDEGSIKRILNGLNEVPPIVHASNSATSLWHSDTVMNAVRLGDIIYG